MHLYEKIEIFRQDKEDIGGFTLHYLLCKPLGVILLKNAGLVTHAYSRVVLFKHPYRIIRYPVFVSVVNAPVAVRKDTYLKIRSPAGGYQVLNARRKEERREQ